MKKQDIRVAILRIEGTNCEQESFDAFKRSGANPEFVHLKQLLHIDCNKDEKRNISDFHCVMIPGGFSAGDYITFRIWRNDANSGTGQLELYHLEFL